MLYNETLELIHHFRKTHLTYAAQYIQKQHQSSLANATEVGTGGTPFMAYLRKHMDETADGLID
jgi:indoleamine 2,3-dioxygenase